MSKNRGHIVKNKVQYYKLGAITHLDAKYQNRHNNIYIKIACSIKNRMQYKKCSVK